MNKTSAILQLSTSVRAGRNSNPQTAASPVRWLLLADKYEIVVKIKYLFIIPFIICGYGFLPTTLYFNKNDIKNPNTLFIQHQECGCECPNARIIKGSIIIPNEILSKYSSIDKYELNLTGVDPFNSDTELWTKNVQIKGQVIGVDTTLCNSNDCEVVPIFKVEKWDVDFYYPKFWTYNNSIFQLLFLFSILFSTIFLLFFIGIYLKNLLKK